MPSGNQSIAELLRPEAVRVGLPGRSKTEVIESLLALVADTPEVRNAEQVHRDVFEREAQMSTGVGKGLALPHARSAAVTGTVAAFAVTAEPVPFEAIDEQPVRLLLLLVGPEDARSRHIRLLGRISRLMNREAFRESLLAAGSPEAVIALFEEAEAGLDA